MGARDPADFIRDYVTARARLDSGRGAPPRGETANDLGERLGTPRVQLFGGPYYLHPPPALLLVLPLAWLPWHAAAGAWAAVSLVLLVWLAVSLVAIAAPDLPPGPKTAWRASLLTVALALWPPTLHCIEKGQWSIATAALLAAGYRAIERARLGHAGVLFGLAAAIKATPVVLLVMLLAYGRRALGAMLAMLGGAALLALGVNGFTIWREFFANAAHDAAVWATWLANTASMQGVYARLLTSGPFARPLVVAPLLSQAAFTITALFLLAAGLATMPGRARALDDHALELRAKRGRTCWCAAWLVLPVVLTPLGWTHVVLMLLAPLLVAFRDGSAGTRAGAALVLAVPSIPRQTLMAWAGPVPVAPGSGLVLGVHAIAAIALYAMLLRDSVHAARGGSALYSPAKSAARQRSMAGPEST